MSDDRVGRVLGSEHTNTAAFRVVIDESEYLQLDDLVVVRTQVPKAGEVRTYGVVTEVEAVYEGASFESDTHRIAELGIMPAQKVRSAMPRTCSRGSWPLASHRTMPVHEWPPASVARRTYQEYRL